MPLIVPSNEAQMVRLTSTTRWERSNTSVATHPLLRWRRRRRRRGRLPRPRPRSRTSPSNRPRKMHDGREQRMMGGEIRGKLTMLALDDICFWWRFLRSGWELQRGYVCIYLLLGCFACICIAGGALRRFMGFGIGVCLRSNAAISLVLERDRRNE